MKTGGLLGIPFIVPLIAVLIVGAVAGAVVHKTAVEPSLKFKSEYTWILATLAVGIIMKNAVEQIWSTGDYKLPSALGDRIIHFSGIGVYAQEILIVFVSLAIVIGVEVFKRKTIYGKAIQAVSEDKDTASLMGIHEKFIIRLSFMMSATIAAIAGLLVAPLTFVSASMGTVIGIKAYSVSIIGGLESGIGPLVGGLILGVSETLTARYISTGYKEMPGFIFLIIVILFKPNGLFGKKIIKKV
jgi:branched-chain amino acid transport system permease protein